MGGRPAQGEDCTPAAAGNDNDLEMDSGAAEDGVMDTRNQSAVSLEKVILCQYSGLISIKG